MLSGRNALQIIVKLSAFSHTVLLMLVFTEKIYTLNSHFMTQQLAPLTVTIPLYNFISFYNQHNHLLQNTQFLFNFSHFFLSFCVNICFSAKHTLYNTLLAICISENVCGMNDMEMIHDHYVSINYRENIYRHSSMVDEA